MFSFKQYVWNENPGGKIVQRLPLQFPVSIQRNVVMYLLTLQGYCVLNDTVKYSYVKSILGFSKINDSSSVIFLRTYSIDDNTLFPLTFPKVS